MSLAVFLLLIFGFYVALRYVQAHENLVREVRKQTTVMNTGSDGTDPGSSIWAPPVITGSQPLLGDEIATFLMKVIKTFLI